VREEVGGRTWPKEKRFKTLGCTGRDIRDKEGFRFDFFYDFENHKHQPKTTQKNMQATHRDSFYLIRKNKQWFSLTKFLVKKINVGHIFKFMRNHCLIILPVNIMKSENSGCYIKYHQQRNNRLRYKQELVTTYQDPLQLHGQTTNLLHQDAKHGTVECGRCIR
jgi:hypothetical protein